MSHVEEIYKVGGRNFLFLNTPAIDRAPWAGKDGKIIKAIIKSYNSVLKGLVSKWRKEKGDVNAFVYDDNKLFNKILDQPTRYGLKNVTGAALDVSVLGSVDQTYFWLDSLREYECGSWVSATG